MIIFLAEVEAAVVVVVAVAVVMIVEAVVRKARQVVQIRRQIWKRIKRTGSCGGDGCGSPGAVSPSSSESTGGDIEMLHYCAIR